MRIPIFLTPLLILLLCTCDRAPKTQAVGESNSQTVEQTVRPNILFILTDDQGIGDLSLHGNDSIRTPNMDALLTSAAKINRFYVSPVCAPTRASFLSGLYAPRTGAVFVTRRRETMDDAVVTIPEYLRPLGYRTGLFGKWHNGATAPYDPGSQGFDQFLGFTLGHFNDYFSGELENERNERVPFAGDLTDILTDTAAAFLLEDSDDPFFAMLTYQAPHTPNQVAEDHWQAVKARGLNDYNTGIYAMIESVDEQIGRLLGLLEEAGKLDNTIVIFSTDNGPNGDRFRMGLKGTKGHVDEGGVRVPFGIRFPGDHSANGRKYDVQAAHVDLLPTLLDYLGEEVPADLDGRSLMPLLDDDRGTYYDYNRPVYVFKQGYDFKPWPGSMRNRDFLYVLREEGKHELYRLDKDPGQRSDIMTTDADWLEEQRKIGRDMAEQYARFAAGVNPDPSLIAPPIDLDAARGPVWLLAHEGEPEGTTHFNDEFGWANDWFVDLAADGAYWPVKTDTTAVYDLLIRYDLDADRARTLVLAPDKGDDLSLLLPPARSVRLPVADRAERKEVYPRRWAEFTVPAVTIPAGTTRLRISGTAEPGLWVKSLRLRRVAAVLR